MPVEVITFGCRLNAFESEAIRGLAATTVETGETIVVNTCAVTAEAQRQARQTIRRARRARPDARIVVTGCAAQIDPAGFAAMPEIDLVLGNEEKLKAESYAVAATTGAPRVRVGDIMAVRGDGAAPVTPPRVDRFAGRARGTVQVQQGCDHRCTFCVIPFGRGNSRSVPVGAVVSQVRALVEAGYAEIVLTGVDITAYGGDLPGRPSLGQMVRRVLALVPDLKRLRLSSLDPVEIDDALWRLLAEEPRLMPHLHLSLQAGDDLILARMKRRHGRADALAACRRARDIRPDVALGADLIAGFPTEDEEMFGRTLALVDECDLAYVHVFPYSARPGTPAARMPQVPSAAIRERAARLRAAASAALGRALRRHVGAAAEVVVERGGVGRTPQYAPVRLDAATSALPEFAVGRLARVRLAGVDGEMLTGVPA
jgi:threonylcarbamoyladenosine tRNA methylthiotransferase MtaB